MKASIKMYKYMDLIYFNHGLLIAFYSIAQKTVRPLLITIRGGSS